ncbi:MAG TPA: DUF177 domain-containing protein [Clostridiales bacterium]|jgi:uncharacterized protein|nr:DUF177 domain-containing protein [Clostridiales bacterium]HRT82606.1 DUF177 domain-containing protein [Oscillospiraceae bacterium]
MLIDLEHIFNNEGAEKSFEYELDFSQTDLADYLPFTQPVQIKGKVKNSAGVVSISATVYGKTLTECDRCASDITGSMSVPVEHILVTRLSGDDDTGLILVEDAKLDLDSLAREDILLAMPTKVLCADDCKGLCAGCGVNLNYEECRCEKPIDPRLDVLRQLLDETNS